ncbi:carbohydrate esterase family 8 protein [Cercophora scortea]|uniref:pectinesterase n=1 Tax=Cercophora scortea TaxID=314031 RepID=A0AAE0MMT3_9PEZI|nr:carbohydrate esterase family 8 protein [Cercophora scortea]
MNQAAIDSLATSTTGNSTGYILIAPGNYTEQLNVTKSAPLTLLGMSSRPWTDQASANSTTTNTPTPANEVQIWWSAANHDAVFADNVFTGVLTVGPTLNATLTGSGPTGFPVPDDTPYGCADFRAYNIDFRNLNENRLFSNGPAHAVGVSRANAGFYSCGLYSWQDTLYVGKLGNAYFYDTIIAGQTDFLYGFGTAYVEQSVLSLRGCGGGITAWKGTNTTAANKYGVYIARSRVLAANETVAGKIKGKCALGRPWNAQHRSIFMDSYLGASVTPAGYVRWSTAEPRVDEQTLMATWAAYGPGYNETAERGSNVTRVLDDEQVRPYKYPVDVFLGDVGWIDQSVLHGREGA